EPGAAVAARAQTFVEFASLQTAAGLAFKAFSDDLSVRIDGGDVVIAKQDGLTLSASRGIGNRDTAAPARDGAKVAGLVDFAGWAAGGPDQLFDRVEQLELGVAMLPRVQAAALRRELAQLYLAHQLA